MPRSDEAVANLRIKVSRHEVREVATSGQGEQKTESAQGTLLVRAAHAARQGVRDSMEDAHVFEENFSETRSRCTSGSHCLFGVFDGHGGATAADCCSRRFPEILKKYLRLCDHVHTALKKAIEECDEEVVEYATDGSGSTGTIVLVDTVSHDLYVANVGDSRCILVSDPEKLAAAGLTNRIEENIDPFLENPHPMSEIGVRQLSIEHKPKDQKEKDRITQCGGFVVGGRVMGVLGVSRAFGDRDFKQLNGDLIVSWPDITHHKLSACDEFIVIACDGLYDVMTNDEVGTFLREHGLVIGNNMERLARSIVDEAIRNRRAHDNVSTIVIKVKLEEPPDTKEREHAEDRPASQPLGVSESRLSQVSVGSIDPDEAGHRRVGHAEHADIVEYAAANLPSVESRADVHVQSLDPTALDDLADEYPRDSFASTSQPGQSLISSTDIADMNISESGDAIIEDVSEIADPNHSNVQTAVV